MEDPAITRIIEQDIADAKRLNVTKTPGYFVNGKPLVTFGYRQRQLVDAVEGTIIAAGVRFTSGILLGNFSIFMVYYHG